jgi:hypothetical protein
MKTTVSALALLLCLSAPTIAADCNVELQMIDAALETNEVLPEVKEQVRDMRIQAEKLCKAGNVQEGLDVIAEASALLGAQ